MPTVYRQISTRYEWRRGAFSLRLSVSDDYPSLFKDEPDVTVKTIDCVKVSTLKEDLEDTDGKFVEDELAIDVDSTMCRSADEKTLLQLMLECVDPDTPRYILIEIAEGGSSTYVQLFRGVLRSDIQGTDIRWYGAEYGDAPTPERTYKFAAKSHAVALLDTPLSTLVPKPNEFAHAYWSEWAAWRSANVKAYLAYGSNYDIAPVSEYDTEHKWSAAYFVSLADINQILRYLADRLQDEVGDPSFQVFIDTSEIGMTFGTPELKPFMLGGSPLAAFIAESIYAVEHRTTHSRDDVAFGDGQQGFKVDIRLLQTTEEDEVPYSWLRYKSFSNTVYALARPLGMFALFEYDENGDLHIVFKSREDVFRDSAGDVKFTYVRDVDSGSIKTQPTTVNAEKEQYQGFANAYALEGGNSGGKNTMFRDDKGNYTQSELRKAVKASDKQLALTIGTTIVRQVDSTYGVEFDRVLNTMPYVEGPTGPSDPPASIAWGGMGDIELTTAIYVDTEDEIYYEPSGSASAPVASVRRYDSVRPVTQVDVNINGVQETFTELSEYVNRLKGLDGKYFEAEYELSVPYLSAFRRSPAGADSYFNLDLGSTITIDENDYVVVGRESDFDNITTKLRLHRLERFSIFGRPTTVQSAVINGGVTVSTTKKQGGSTEKTFIAGENISAGWAVTADALNIVRKARPVTGDYNRVIGVAIAGAAAGESVPICTSGVCSVPDTYAAGEPVWLRSGSPNMSTTRITIASPTEHVDQKIGTSLGGGQIEVNIGRPFIWHPFEV